MNRYEGCLRLPSAMDFSNASALFFERGGRVQDVAQKRHGRPGREKAI
jgi:hypothetical protein